MTIVLTNLKYVSADNRWIDMDVSIDGAAAFPFTYNPDDTAPLTVALHDVLQQTNPSIAAYVAPVAPAISVVSPRQIRLALTASGLRTDVETYIATQSQDVKDSWNYSTAFEINHPLLQAAKTALNKTDADLQALFDLAATL